MADRIGIAATASALCALDHTARHDGDVSARRQQANFAGV